jgi:hypothetical protein
MPIHVDHSRLPLVVIRFEGAPSDDEFVRYLDDVAREVFALDRPHGMVIDAARMTSMSAKQRRMQADWMEKHDASVRRNSVGNAMVITSPLIRGALTAILWIRPMPGEHVVVSTFAEAERWIIEKLRARGLRVPGVGRTG